MAATETKKLTKKEQKALEFRKTKEEREESKQTKRAAEEAKAEEPVKKKRKTRRGRKGKGRDDKKGNRFILFVGSLPKDITEKELKSHFSSSAPDTIRLRAEKGIAFLEFDGDKDPKSIQRRIDIALLQHRTTIRDKAINVELTVGGGGNNNNRLQKLKEKNEKLDVERQERVRKMIESSASKKTQNTNKFDAAAAKTAAGGIHPDRLKLMK